jgi:two-component system, NarL family, sensor histidine kinase DegS
VLTRRADYVSLIIDDDGTGFDQERTSGARQPGLGLAGMRERVMYIGGTFDSESRPGHGVTIVVRIPISGECGGA